MTINAVATQTSVVQTIELENKPKAQEQKEVSFWSKDWTAGNFVREKIGWEGLADWLVDKDKVCTDGKDDGKLGFGETMESFGKGLAGLVKGAMNHPIATAVTVGVGAAAVALTGGAILPVMVAAGATMGAGMIGVGAYKAATADTDAEAKQAWETIGTGVFTVGASALGAKSALKQANKAGVTSAQSAKDLSVGKALIQNFKSIPEALKVSATNAKANFLRMVSGTLQSNSNMLRNLELNKPEELNGNIAYNIKPGTKVSTVDGVRTIADNEIVIKTPEGLNVLKFEGLKGVNAHREEYIIEFLKTREEILASYPKEIHPEVEALLSKNLRVKTCIYSEGFYIPYSSNERAALISGNNKTMVDIDLLANKGVKFNPIFDESPYGHTYYGGGTYSFEGNTYPIEKGTHWANAKWLDGLVKKYVLGN